MSVLLRRLRRPWAAAALILGLPGALLGGHAASLQMSGNFHPILEGEAYRSAQPTAESLARWTVEKGLRSVLNLRGENPDSPWWREEAAAAERLGLVHADFRMSASEDLPQARAAELLALLKSLPKPLLIHCRSGSDRTGLAAALYLAEAGEGEARAESQISFRYGHVSLPFTAAWPMDRSWEALEGWLGYPD